MLLAGADGPDPKMMATFQQGIEIFIEQDHQPTAVLKVSASMRPGRNLSECIALAEAHEAKIDFTPVPDEDFAKDMRGGIAAPRDSFEPSAGE